MRGVLRGVLVVVRGGEARADIQQIERAELTVGSTPVFPELLVIRPRGRSRSGALVTVVVVLS